MANWKHHQIYLFIFLLIIFIVSYVLVNNIKQYNRASGKTTKSALIVPLPKINRKNTMSLEEAIEKRRSVRQFTLKPVSEKKISSLLWAAQGITDKQHQFRTVPSAGALYPLEIYILKNNGVWHYLAKRHALELTLKEDKRTLLAKAAFEQTAIERAPLVILITSFDGRTTKKYGEKGVRYAHIEAGHAAQNLLLEAVSLGLSGVTIGAFEETKVKELLQLPHEEIPLYLIPIGYKK